MRFSRFPIPTTLFAFGALLISVSGAHGQLGSCCVVNGRQNDFSECRDTTATECQALDGYFDPVQQCGMDHQRCPLNVCLGRPGSCTEEHETFCLGGQLDGQVCFVLEFPSRCSTNAMFGNECGGNCVGGLSDGDLCDPFEIHDCAGMDCAGGECMPAYCKGEPGCADPLCCTNVCLQPGKFFCCGVTWDELCAEEAVGLCTCVDDDGDGFGFPGSAYCPKGLAEDCNDDNETVFPGAVEVLCNGVDENCNGDEDDDQNKDGDPVSLCDGDCDDTDPANFPGNREICDGQDNNCDGQIDFRFRRGIYSRCVDMDQKSNSQRRRR